MTAEDANVEVVQRLYEAWNGGDIAAALELIDPEIEVETSSGRLTEGSYRGYAGLTQVMDDFWGEFDERRTDLKECIPVGDAVATSVLHVARGRASGATVEMPHYQVWTLRDGKVVRWRMFGTWPEALEAARLSA
jgi:uncharacterized protein